MKMSNCNCINFLDFTFYPQLGLFIVAFISNTVFAQVNLFSEKSWGDAVASMDSSLLYAPHLKDGSFFNPWMPMPEKGFLDVMRWRLFSKKEKFTLEEEAYLPNVVSGAVEQLSSKTAGNFVMWLGHSSIIIRLNDELFLLDPVLSKRAAIIKRLTPPAITPKELSSLDMKITVLLTHNHYDHLDKPTISALPKESFIIAPLGHSKILHEMGRSKVHELDWWESFDCGNGIKIHAVPAQHWSLRAFSKRNRSLWCSFVIETGDGEIFVGGDSGYFHGFKEVGRRFKNIKLAILPIGASRPRWFMHYAHMDPKEALLAANDLGAEKFMPIHWGAFRLGEEPAGYPALELMRLIENETGIYKGKISMPNIGDAVLFASP